MAEGVSGRGALSFDPERKEASKEGKGVEDRHVGEGGKGHRLGGSGEIK